MFCCRRSGCRGHNGIGDSVAGGRNRPLDRLFPPQEPIRGPDTVEAPAEGFELLLTQAVAVARRRGGVVGRAIAFDREDELAGAFRVPDDKVDPVARGAPLPNHIEAVGAQSVGDIRFERVQTDIAGAALSKPRPTACDVLQVSAEERWPTSLCALGVDVLVGERGDKRHAPARPRNRDVQAALATLLIDRAEVV